MRYLQMFSGTAPVPVGKLGNEKSPAGAATSTCIAAVAMPELRTASGGVPPACTISFGRRSLR